MADGIKRYGFCDVKRVTLHVKTRFLISFGLVFGKVKFSYGHWSLRVEHLALQTWQILTMKVVMTSALIFDEKGFGGASTVTNGRPSTSRGDERGTKCENQD